jgi:hypothetical protein
MPNFGELRKAEVQLLRISLPRTPVNKKLVVRCVLVEDRGGGQGWRTGVEAGQWTFCYRSEGREKPSEGLGCLLSSFERRKVHLPRG